MSIKIITDSSVDLPEELLQQHNISVVPLNIHFQDKNYKAGVDIDTPTFYEKMKTAKELPKSSAPAPQDFIEKFNETDEQDELVVLSLSKGISSTFENAVLAKTMFLEDHPDRSIEIINTKSASAGLGLLVLKAAEMVEAGNSFQEIVSSIQDDVDDLMTMFVLDTLENVIKGGRLDKVKGKIASALNIKLLLRASEEGTIEMIDKVRGNKRAIREFIDRIGKYGHNLETKVLAIAHSNCEDKARALMEQIQERYKVKRVILSSMGPLIGTYAGEGALLVAFQKN
ncbi:DegV family protein [Pseudalkalibacillus caeni]|uniref:DegV family protein n=1 Tax=Exobacillus caeni TaxID=2574798 RepID=A0A5R9EUS0_9BACL|nr:DegV family protein [Pseudalkalibacillus caeni]TLS34942.1 DegV family protein [Pseudalkalibacillus caeni]